MDWVEVTPAQAAQRRYYGLGGWLLFFYVLAVLDFVAGFMTLMASPTMQRMHGDNHTIVAGLGVVQALLYLPFIVMTPMKHPLMPKATISALWFGVALTAIVGLLTGPMAMMVRIVAGVVFVSLFQWYLNKSKRVNVTFRHRVPAEAGTSGAEPAS